MATKYYNGEIVATNTRNRLPVTGNNTCRLCRDGEFIIGNKNDNTLYRYDIRLSFKDAGTFNSSCFTASYLSNANYGASQSNFCITNDRTELIKFLKTIIGDKALSSDYRVGFTVVDGVSGICRWIFLAIDASNNLICYALMNGTTKYTLTNQDTFNCNVIKTNLIN